MLDISSPISVVRVQIPIQNADHSPDLTTHSVFRSNKVESLTSALTNCCGACGTAATRFLCTLHVHFFFSFLRCPQTCLHSKLNIHSCSPRHTSVSNSTFITKKSPQRRPAGFLCARQVCPSTATHVLKLATHETLNLRNSNKTDRYQALNHKTDSTEALDIIDSLCLRSGACRVHEACTSINLVLAAEA